MMQLHLRALREDEKQKKEKAGSFFSSNRYKVRTNSGSAVDTAALVGVV